MGISDVSEFDVYDAILCVLSIV